MTVHAIAFTQRGQSLEGALGIPVDRGVPVMKWTQEHFDTADALIYIGAAAIAVRAIAPHIKDKTTDPAVLAIDEAGKYVIPLLSGHIGGANALAVEIAKKIGAEAVITTASDIRGLPAIDVWATQNDCAIENPEAIKAFSARVLAGRSVGTAITERSIVPPFAVTLFLRPRTLVLGAGCKKGIDKYCFEKCALDFLKTNGLSLLSLKALATIDIKKDEAAFRYFCDKYALPLMTYDALTLRALPGTFAHSDFVEKTVGVGNVCERAAVCASNGRLLVGKTKYEGLTLALAGDENT